jgi:hypothetical protein
VGERASALRVVVHWEYRFDRLLAAKLEQAYQVLVPDQRWPVGGAGAPPAEESVNEHPSRPVCTRVVGPAAGAGDDRESDGRAAGVCRRA